MATTITIPGNITKHISNNAAALVILDDKVALRFNNFNQSYARKIMVHSYSCHPLPTLMLFIIEHFHIRYLFLFFFFRTPSSQSPQTLVNDVPFPQPFNMFTPNTYAHTNKQTVLASWLDQFVENPHDKNGTCHAPGRCTYFTTTYLTSLSCGSVVMETIHCPLAG